MWIGEFSKRTGVSPRLIRYYEKKGLLTPGRDRNGYRTYQESDIQAMESVRMYLSLGLRTAEAGRLISCESNPSPRPLCRTAHVIYEQQLADINQRIKVLLHARDVLQKRLISSERKDEKNDY